MDDFETFMEHLKNGDFDGVKKSLRPEFLEIPDDFEMRPIHEAASGGYVDIAKYLIDQNCDIECRADLGWRPIHLACRYGYLDMAKHLIDKNCDIECKTDSGWRPIHLACRYGHLDIAKHLIDKNCDIECKTDSDWRPIHFACSNGHVDIAKHLIDKNCNIECKTDSDWRPIHFACSNGHIDILKLLFRNGCEFRCQTKTAKSPFHLAILEGHETCQDFLIEATKLEQFFDRMRRNKCDNLDGLNCADVLIKEEPVTCLSFLEVAIQLNNTELIKYLLDKRVDNTEILPLKNYIEDCHRPEAVKLILECLLYRSIRDHHADGFELSCLANIVNGHRKIVSSSFLEITAEHGASTFIHEILRKTIYNKKEWIRAKNLAILNGNKKIVDAIWSREILLTSRAKAHFSTFHTAICDNDPDMMGYVFENHLAEPDFNNEVVGTGLSLAYMLSHIKCIETLQEFNVDVNTQNKYSQSPLHEAISSGMTDHCSYLISRARDIDKPGFMGFTGLQCAVMEGCENLCDELVRNGADCIQYVEGLPLSYFRNTALPISKRENAVTLCLKMQETIYPCFLKVLDSNKVNCSDANENTLLHLAVKTLLPDLCNSLIHCGADVAAINAQGNTPLLELFSHLDHRIINDNVDKIITICNILIDSGTDINLKSRLGVTVFEGASKCNSERLMIYILSKNPDLQIVTENDFKLAFANSWFVYFKTLVHLMPTDSLKSFISTETFCLTMPHADPKLLKSLFIKASSVVQQSVIEDLLRHFSTNDEYDEFMNLLETEIIEPKWFSNGETLLTSLLKDKNEKYSWAIIHHAANRKCFNLANVLNQMPLQIAIERELYDLICPLVFDCDQLNNEDINGNTPLIQLFQKLSLSPNINTGQKLKTAVKTIISRGGDIYMTTSRGIKTIQFCSGSALKSEFEAFQKMERNRNSNIIVNPASRNICTICLDRELDCVYECGHTFCTTCGEILFQCPMCFAELKNPRKFYIN